MTSTRHSQTAVSTPVSLASSEAGIAQTVNTAGVPASNVAVGQGETMPNAIGLLLVALVGLVAVSRRGIRHIGKER